jgi:hypothetical protein
MVSELVMEGMQPGTDEAGSAIGMLAPTAALNEREPSMHLAQSLGIRLRGQQ